MSFQRADAVTYITGTHAQLLSEVGLDDDDVTGELKEPIDEALLLVGVPYADLASPTIADEDVLGLYYVLDYTVLKRCHTSILGRVDVTLDGPNMSKRRSQMVTNLQNRMTLARSTAEPYIPSSGSFSLSTWQMDFIEPVEE